MLGKGSRDCIVTLVERKTRYTIIGKLKARTIDQLNARLLQIIKRHRKSIKTITADNGTEFHGYKSIEQKTGAEILLRHPVITRGNAAPTKTPTASFASIYPNPNQWPP